MAIAIRRLPQPFDRNKAEQAINDVLNRLSEAGPEAAMRLEEPVRALIAALAGNSPYLRRTILAHPALLPDLVALGPDALFAREIAALDRAATEAPGVEALMRLLRRHRARMALLVAAADVAALWPLERVTRALSDFAERAVGHALAHLLFRRMRQGEIAWPGRAFERPEPAIAEGSGLIVLGLGKLGARELNYSSDIDLIVLYDEEVVPYRGERALGEAMVRLTQELVRILETRTADGYVFRTDLRLRPDPGATPVALSVGAAETYYQSVALNWERAAMIKARQIAGDRAAGEAYLDRLAPFIWRRHLDYAAIEDIHAIKNQIHRHHGHRGIDLPGLDIKLGPGGIREIEFYAQINQLIHGGRDESLRVRDTLGALDRLVARGRIAADVRDDLRAAYIFYRTLEHRLQMIDDVQTHRLPKDDEGLRHVATFMGFDDRATFESRLRAHLGRVARHYDALLPHRAAAGEAPASDAIAELLADKGFASPENALAIIERWRRGRYRALRTERGRKLLEASLPRIIEAFAATAEPDQCLARFDHFLAKLPAGIQLFSLFQSNPSLFRLIARVMGMAPVLAERLARRPQLIDTILDPDFFAPLPDRATLEREFAAALARARDYEDLLDIARRWAEDRRFQLGVHILEALTHVRAASEFMTDLAEVTLSGLMRPVRAAYERRHGAFPGGALAVVAMGKFGGRELSFASDLDLILLYDVEGGVTESDGPRPVAASRYFSGLGQALLTAMTALTPEGRLWEVDTRLRPSGSAGPLVVTVETFVDYYAERAWTWEHMALTRARVVVAPPRLAARIRESISRILTRQRDLPALLPAVASMRERLRAEFGTDNPWSVKHVRGGFVDMEFVVQFLLLCEGARNPRIFAPRLDDCIDNLVTAKVLDVVDGETMRVAHGLYHAVQGLLRLTVGDAPTPEDFTPDLEAALVRATGRGDFTRLRSDLISAQTAVARIYDRIIAGPAAKLATSNRESMR
ncbi:MAG: bifunctional [glutamine synthetase] adenylyltransferase/[glutamine synthetase]-adenylyl-L-tyrosine phosphorylase [Rhodothalassiaceae bacterium]